MRWDLFCRVVDNYGDVGVCWRLAAELGRRGEQVRLWIDDASPLRWMAPQGASGVTVQPWPGDGVSTAPGDVVVEAFGCSLPDAFVARMAAARPAPTWINLEYLSAEPYVERSHGLRSPQLSGPGAGLDKWFFYPGFTAGTGGLLRGQAPEDPGAWMQAHGWAAQPGERIVLLFCYANPALPALLEALAQSPTLVLVAPGPEQQRALTLAAQRPLRTIALPWLPQHDFDQLLHCTDLNFVRGEDSFVQAQWAAAPFVWQIYPQHDQAHATKLDAFVDRFVGATALADGAALRALWHGWNGLAPLPSRWPQPETWRQASHVWRDRLGAQIELTSRLIEFVTERR